jgi:Asp-tRNA(Asn)/Glu-tRNA(Gln) amidotransferase A subunit family amidase
MMLSALDLARRIAAGEFTPARVVDMCAEAIAAREPAVGAFAALDIAAARRAADAPGLATQPLAGLPVGIKDIFDTVDFPTEYGSPIYAGHRPAADAAMVMLVRRAGGIVLGKTATAELASASPVPTRNPHDVAHTPGGSSCGSAAAVAAGMVPIAIGSQTGGSVIRPAAFCGVAGFKPSYRLLPTAGMKCVSHSLDTVGLFAASVADVAYAAAVVGGRDWRVDGRALPAPGIALVRTHLWSEADPDMQSAIADAARAAERAGASVKEVVLPNIFEQAMAAHQTVSRYESYRSLAFEYDLHRDRLGEFQRKQLEAGAAVTADDYDNARRTARRARQAFLELIADGVIVLTPSATGAAPRGNDSGAAPFNRLWSLLGVPAINVPGLTNREGMPLGLQVVARFGRDRFALSAAAFLEGALVRSGAAESQAAQAAQ